MSSHTNPPNWLDWFSIALPVSIAIDLAIWGLLLLYYKPDREVTEVLPLRASTDPINSTQVPHRLAHPAALSPPTSCLLLTCASPPAPAFQPERTAS